MTNTTMAHPPELSGRTLVRELTLRINNQLAAAINVMTAAAVRAEHPETKLALGNVTELLQEQANVHRVLDPGRRCACRRRPISPQALPRDNPVPIGANRRPSLVSGRHLAARTREVLASRDGRPRAGDEFSAACLLRRQNWRDQDQAVAGAPGSQLHHCGQRVALHAVETGAGARPRSRFDQEPGRSARIWLWPRILILSFGVCADRTRAAGQQGSRVAPR
jgi:hypothetical protein